MDQKTDSLQGWLKKMIQKYGIREAERLRSRLTVKKSARHYNSRNRVIPETVFQYKNRQYVMTGQISGGLYYRAHGCGDQNFPFRKVRIIRQNKGLVYTA